MEDQDDLIIRKPECDELGSEAALEDVGHNADLYIAIQEDVLVLVRVLVSSIYVYKFEILMS